MPKQKAPQVITRQLSKLTKSGVLNIPKKIFVNSIPNDLKPPVRRKFMFQSFHQSPKQLNPNRSKIDLSLPKEFFSSQVDPNTTEKVLFKRYDQLNRVYLRRSLPNNKRTPIFNALSISKLPSLVNNQ